MEELHGEKVGIEPVGPIGKMVMILVLAAAVVGLVAVVLAERPEKRWRANLGQIGVALTQYMHDYGWTPPIYPEASRLANAQGVPGGAVLAFRGADGEWHASGLGILLQEAYVAPREARLLFSPLFEHDDPVIQNAFSYDKDEPFFVSGDVQQGSNGNGKGELPDNPDVIVAACMARRAKENFGSVKYDPTFVALPAIVSDLLLFKTTGPDAPCLAWKPKRAFGVLLIDGSAVCRQDLQEYVQSESQRHDIDGQAREIVSCLEPMQGPGLVD